MHRAESGLYRLAKVIEEKVEAESKKVFLEYIKCKKRAWVEELSLVGGHRLNQNCVIPVGGAGKGALHRAKVGIYRDNI